MSRMTFDLARTEFDEVIDDLNELYQEHLKRCPKPGADPVAEARWEGAALMLLGVLRDHLDPVKRAWEKGEPSRWSSEKAMAPAREPSCGPWVRWTTFDRDAP